MAVLPDYLDQALRVVFCGTAAGLTSAARGHFYSGAGNEFWRYLFEAGFTPRRLAPSDDETITSYGFGLNDLAKNIATSNDRRLAGAYDIAAFVDKIERYAPKYVALHGKQAAKVLSRALGRGREASLGLQPWRIANSRVFVLPSASGANRDPRRLEGNPSRVAGFSELRELSER